MDRIMSTSTILLDKNSNANNVDIMVFEPSLLFPPCRSIGGGGNWWHGPLLALIKQVFQSMFSISEMKNKLRFHGILFGRG